MKILVALILASCAVDAPSFGRAYYCNGSGSCTYQGREVTFNVPDGETCSTSEGSAEDWYLDELEAWSSQTACEGAITFVVKCSPGDVCTQ